MNGFYFLNFYAGLLDDLNTPSFGGYSGCPSASTPSATSTSREPLQGEFKVKAAACIQTGLKV